MKRLATIILALGSLAVGASAQNIDPSLDYQIGPRDLVEVTVAQDPSINTETRVGPDGAISLPILGAVEIGGMSPVRAARHIADLLEAKVLTEADVAVVVKEFQSEAVSIFGEVQKPGKIPVVRNMTLLQAITAAGGPTASAGQTIKVLRVASNGLTSQLDLDLQELLDGSPDVNIPLSANDVISVPHDPEISVYLLGEVMSPAAVRFKQSERATLLKAIAEAGGFTDRAHRGRIEIIREGADDPAVDERMTVDVDRIMKGEQPDVRLRNGDRIYVRQSLF